MKKSKFPEVQFTFALKPAETRVSVEDIFQNMGIHHATYYNKKNKFEVLG